MSKKKIAELEQLLAAEKAKNEFLQKSNNSLDNIHSYYTNKTQALFGRLENVLDDIKHEHNSLGIRTQKFDDYFFENVATASQRESKYRVMSDKIKYLEERLMCLESRAKSND
jgi:hypothetical protein